MMKRFCKNTFYGVIILLSFLFEACSEESNPQPQPEPDTSSFFIRGADLSLLPDIEKYGIQFYDKNGNVSDMLSIMKVAGCNTVRIRLWYEPADENSSFEQVRDFAAKVKAKGMDVWLCIHYSDTWADPGHQTTPRAWSKLQLGELKDSVYQYTYRVVREIQPLYVQTGNEVNDGFLWPLGRISTGGSFYALMAEAVKAAKAASPTTHVMIHYAGLDGAAVFFNQLKYKNVDFDAIGLSYYPYYHGKDMSYLTSVMNSLSKNIQRPVVIAETSYPFTLQWYDNTHNLIGIADQLIDSFPASPEGQKSYMMRIRHIVEEIEQGAGFCYWGGEWVAYKGPNATNGSPWENQTLFDFEMKALPVLDVFKD